MVCTDDPHNTDDDETTCVDCKSRPPAHFTVSFL
jgi:hypothetical protein